MVHQIRLICFFDCLGNDLALHIAPIDIIVFKITVSSGDQRFTDIAGHSYTAFVLLDLQEVRSDIFSINMINDILSVTVAGCMQLLLVIHDELKRYFRV